MNVKYTENDAKDVARRLKVDYSTVTGWCRRGLINFIVEKKNVAIPMNSTEKAVLANLQIVTSVTLDTKVVTNGWNEVKE